jgi:hypothetical protein
VQSKEAYTEWFKLLGDFPKVYRGTLGVKIESYFLELLESIFTAFYLPPPQKIIRLTTAVSKLDGVKFFLQLAWENRCISAGQYASLSEKLGRIGKMLHGWKIGIEKKTPAR